VTFLLIVVVPFTAAMVLIGLELVTMRLERQRVERRLQRVVERARRDVQDRRLEGGPGGWWKL
jgi:hypothetical protein